MKIGEQDEALAEVPVLLFDRLLDLDDHLGKPPDIVRRADDLRSGSLIFVVRHRREDTGIMLDQHLMPGLHQRLDAGRRYSHAALVILYLFWNANNHFASTSGDSDCIYFTGSSTPMEMLLTVLPLMGTLFAFPRR